ncbi:competence type IV pilus minor pilin ComGF [Listeria innocua]|uniref:competence type IV pilus minor pilin ComGF n=1 Tax=Listeria innocua TaxID=1642 RepID=UPI00086DFC85|nr:competence type IV pilus minor pilin ComGF [Listeria innocua]OEO35427.1 competence protein ComGF [Listeria monocytogenes]MBC1440477.1 competence protein ComGF [Listeria innocua]MDG0895940.1 competence type IV pilus minor pilin ComGF [Listeria innocua]MDH4593500.1 competence protein ComGF [Listeria innocua]UVW25688.1 competence type IV pilus minor pilin ComGF [Listeria innocua]
MQKLIELKNVHYRKSTSAFTLLETILSITIVLSISSLIPLFFECYHKTIQLSNLDQTSEWQLFLVQTRLELEKATNIQVNSEKLSFKVNDNLVTYSKYNNILRRQVNGKGHEPLLHKVTNWQITNEENQLILKVTFSNNKFYTSKFPLTKANEF